MSGSALTISPAKFNDALEEVEKLKGKLKKVQAAGEEKAGMLITGVAIVGTEVALGIARGRFGEQQIADLPWELPAGIAAEIAALTGVFGKYSEVAASVGHGTLGFVGAVEGIKWGEEMRAKAEGRALPSSTPKVVETQGQTVAAGTAEARTAPEQLPSGERRVVTSVGRTMAEDNVEQPASKKKTGT